jgi:hypothetical protein
LAPLPSRSFDEFSPRSSSGSAPAHCNAANPHQPHGPLPTGKLRLCSPGLLNLSNLQHEITAHELSCRRRRDSLRRTTVPGPSTRTPDHPPRPTTKYGATYATRAPERGEFSRHVSLAPITLDLNLLDAPPLCSPTTSPLRCLPLVTAERVAQGHPCSLTCAFSSETLHTTPRRNRTPLNCDCAFHPRRPRTCWRPAPTGTSFIPSFIWTLWSSISHNVSCTYP